MKKYMGIKWIKTLKKQLKEFGLDHHQWEIVKITNNYGELTYKKDPDIRLGGQIRKKQGLLQWSRLSLVSFL